ncbi:MAG TPA: aldo/keto reductase [Armatimonadetes bacterium]|nr:aldo/keto reductase [Armatimonadota bacterium]
MEKIRLGRTGLMVTRVGFGALPLQRVDRAEAARILCRAYDAGINFYDTARGYTDSEEKIGDALSGVRDRIVIATKSAAKSREGVLQDLEKSLRNLKTDYVDLLQLHNPRAMPDPEDPGSSYAGLLEAREKGMVRFIGFTNHSRERALQAVESGLFDTLQFPFSAISSMEELALIGHCQQADVGVIAMKPLCGGLLTEARPAFAFLWQFENVVPIWGIQRMEELEESLALASDPPVLDAALRAEIERDRQELAGDFCRGCGYCQPCPEEIPIPMAARMSLLLRRSPYQPLLTEEWAERMMRIEKCRECGECMSRCPYGLEIPRLLQEMLADYKAFRERHMPLPAE